MGSFKDALSTARELAVVMPYMLKAAANPPSDDDVDNLAARLGATAAAVPDKTAIIFEGNRITWGALNHRVSRVAEALRAQGVGRGDCVSLLMENRIEFIEYLFGIFRVGAEAALINTNLRGPQLIHCITTTGAKRLVVGSELAPAVAQVSDDCQMREGEDFLWVADGEAGPAPNWAVDFGAVCSTSEPIAASRVAPVQRRDRAMYIFTSGTTGLPKAAIQKHGKVLSGMDSGCKVGFKASPEDCLYLCLPLYHASGLMVGFMPALQAGSTVFLRRKFSASKFLDEAREHQCNSFIYIGELCRYLLAQPEKPDDGDNPIRKMTGNGLRPDIWMEFKNRFRVERIIEFYGASEGNTGFINFFNRDCTVGIAIAPPALVQYDVDSDEIVRDDNGFCLRAGDGQPGLLLGAISALFAFEGYTDKAATEKKVLRNVFKEGDAFFNTGDLVKTVNAGFAFGMKHYQFVDRVGDTFRWKGENCSTNEVGEIINRHPDVQVCNVYGVQMPGTDGRAGMAAIVLREGAAFDADGISDLVRRDLASYARPVFIRLQSELEMTGTFKMVKGELREEAYHPDKCPDPVYVMKPGNDCYEPLDGAFYRQIMAGAAGY